MRPVNKGLSPYETIGEYSEALPYLEDHKIKMTTCGRMKTIQNWRIVILEESLK